MILVGPCCCYDITMYGAYLFLIKDKECPPPKKCPPTKKCPEVNQPPVQQDVGKPNVDDSQPKVDPSKPPVKTQQSGSGTIEGFSF